MEHFADPAAVLRNALKHLASDGVVVVEVPNDREGIISLNGPDEPHLMFFTQPTLSALLDRVPGCEVAAMFTAGPPNREPSLTATLRDRGLALANRVPMLRRRLAKRHTRMHEALDFGPPVPDGMFLRAVLRRTGAVAGETATET